MFVTNKSDVSEIRNIITNLSNSQSFIESNDFNLRETEEKNSIGKNIFKFLYNLIGVGVNYLKL